MTSRARTAWLAVAVGLLAGAVSLLRILLANGSALATLVWAEDGLFPLCVRVHGLLPCMADPFAGYFLFLPRLVALPVSWVPLDWWPLATNVAAALLAACAAALVVVVLRAAGCGSVAAGLIAILPMVAPITGLEAINATGSGYMLLVFLASLAICFPPIGRFPVVAYAVGALVLALTIPSSVVLLLPLVVQAARRRIPTRSALAVGAMLVAGLAVQAFVALTARDPRDIDVGLASLRAWADAIPNALLTYWPGGATLNADGTLTSGLVPSWGPTGVVIGAVVLVGGIALLVPRRATANGVGLLLLVGLGMGAGPAAAGYANNRYFVIPALLWLAAALIALDHSLRGRRDIVMALVAAVLIIAWAPVLPASDFRATAVPEWAASLEQARSACAADPDATILITFSPAWPFPDAVFVGPTTNAIPCRSLA